MTAAKSNKKAMHRHQYQRVPSEPDEYVLQHTPPILLRQRERLRRAKRPVKEAMRSVAAMSLEEKPI